jgi:hypothetical protein
VRARKVADTTPTERVTPESYLGYERLDRSRYAGTSISPDTPSTYEPPTQLAQNVLAFGGVWNVGHERAAAGLGAQLLFHVHARNVYLVLGGKGIVDVRLSGAPSRTVHVDGDRLYTLVAGTKLRDGLLDLRFTPGLTAYAFTFG